MNMKSLIYNIAIIILIIGGINWGLVGFFNFDLVAFIFGALSPLSRFVYIAVGLSAIYVAIAHLYMLSTLDNIK